MDTNDFARFMATLAEKSGEVIKRYYSADDVDVEMKSDATPVTRADREAEALMRDLIRDTYPDHGIIGEEFGEENASAEFVWTLDPIDGTVSFASGCPLFGTLIGLLYQNRPVLGAIHQPLWGQICIGDGRRTTVNGRAVRLRNLSRLSDAILLTTDVPAIRRTRYKEGFDLLLENTHLFRTWGDCYGYLLVASGKADIMLDLDMKIWDIMPLIPIIHGANGVITTWSGGDASQGSSCLATNRALHAQVRQILASRSDPA
jgi:histidinol phosphatase-like enzyme (inositol monophosphatase family)